MLTDFKISFNKFAVRSLLYFPPHLKHVTTLPVVLYILLQHVWLSANHLWCLWAHPSSRKTNLILFDSGWKNNAMTKQLVPVVWHLWFFIFQLTVFLQTEHMRQLAFWNGRHSLSFYQTYDSQRSRSEPGWLQKKVAIFGQRNAGGYTRWKFMMLMNCSNLWFKKVQEMCCANVSMHVFIFSLIKSTHILTFSFLTL